MCTFCKVLFMQAQYTHPVTVWKAMQAPGANFLTVILIFSSLFFPIPEWDACAP